MASPTWADDDDNNGQNLLGCIDKSILIGNRTCLLDTNPWIVIRTRLRKEIFTYPERSVPFHI